LLYQLSYIGPNTTKEREVGYIELPGVGQVLLKKVQVWIFRREKGLKEALFLVFHTNPARGGFWQPVTGGVEPGEAVEAAALREAREESGLTGQLISLQHSFQFESRGNNCEEFAFALDVSQDNFPENAVKIDPHEHDAFLWMNAAQAEEKIRFDSNKAVLRLLTAKLIKSSIA
jgi:8-oxo-dGTP pyrophosphatase MutT (NUDIX family)